MFCIQCGTEFEQHSIECEKCGTTIPSTSAQSEQSFKAIAPVFYDWSDNHFAISPAGWMLFLVSIVGGLNFCIEQRSSQAFVFFLIPFVVLRAINETKWKMAVKAAGKTAKFDWKNLQLKVK